MIEAELIKRNKQV